MDRTDTTPATPERYGNAARISAGFGETETEPIIQIQGLNHSFGVGENKRQVLFDIDLDVTPGEILIMSGPSGSGKTTLLTLIGAVRSIQDGTCRVLGRRLDQLDSKGLVEVRRDIGFVFQHHGLFDALTSHQNVRLAMELHRYPSKEKHQKATDILTQLGLSHRIRYKPGSMSGGQRQRVAVARALVNRPKLVLADEPTAALDKDSGRIVVELLQTMADENGSAILIVTHDNRILDVADRILNMVDGRIVSDVAVKESLEICHFLSHCPVFDELTPAALSEVAESMSKEHFPASATIIEQGEVGYKFFIIKDGEVEVVVEADSSRQVVATLGPGEFFGEAALITGEPRNASVVTKKPVQLYSLGKEDFDKALETSASFREQLLKIFFQRQH